MTNEVNDHLSDAARDFAIACDYESGTHGKPKDLERAFSSMSKAAEDGHCLAAYALCAFYFHGRGTPRDFKSARAWALRVKELGAGDLADAALVMIEAKEREPYADAQQQDATTAPPGTVSEKPTRETFWPGLLGLGSLALLVYVAGEVDKHSPGAGRSLIGWVFGLGALGIFLNIIWARNVKDTVKNFVGLMKGALQTFLAILLVAGIGYCSGGVRSLDSGVLGDLPDNVRKP